MKPVKSGGHSFKVSKDFPRRKQLDWRSERGEECGREGNPRHAWPGETEEDDTVKYQQYRERDSRGRRSDTTSNYTFEKSGFGEKTLGVTGTARGGSSLDEVARSCLEVGV